MRIGEEPCPIGGTAEEEQDGLERLWLRVNSGPERIYQAALSLLDVQTELGNREVALIDREAEILAAVVPVEGGPAEPLLSGKNAQIREAQMRALTERERRALRAQEVIMERAKIQLRLEQDRFSAAKALARLVGETS